MTTTTENGSSDAPEIINSNSTMNNGNNQIVNNSTPAATTVNNTSQQQAPAATVDAPLSLDKLLQMEDELSTFLNRKRELERNLATLEVQLFNAEGRYLEQTAHLGNLVRGFEGYAGMAAGRGADSTPRYSSNSHHYGVDSAVLESDRLFSQSSASFKKSLQQIRDLERNANLNNTAGNPPVRRNNNQNGVSTTVKKKTKKKRSSSAISTSSDSSIDESDSDTALNKTTDSGTTPRLRLAVNNGVV